MHAPTPTNEPGTFYLKLSIIMNPLETDYKGFPVIIGVKSSYLNITSDSYQLLPSSSITEKLNGANLRRIAGGFEIIGPQNVAGMVDGVVLGEEPISQIEVTGSGLDPIEISLTATRRCLL